VTSICFWGCGAKPRSAPPQNQRCIFQPSLHSRSLELPCADQTIRISFSLARSAEVESAIAISITRSRSGYLRRLRRRWWPLGVNGLLFATYATSYALSGGRAKGRYSYRTAFFFYIYPPYTRISLAPRNSNQLFSRCHPQQLKPPRPIEIKRGRRIRSARQHFKTRLITYICTLRPPIPRPLQAVLCHY